MITGGNIAFIEVKETALLGFSSIALLAREIILGDLKTFRPRIKSATHCAT
jgi:hypothetical protein